MINWTKTDLRRQLTRLKKNGLFPLLQRGAEKHHLPLAFVLAVASRETNCHNMLGDGGHGVGIIQIDIRYHEIARNAKADGSWKTHPAPLVDYGCEMLATDRAWAENKWPAFGGDRGHGWLKIAASAYNAGRGGATAGVLAGDSDHRTTGRDYGADVLKRMAVFEELLG